MRVARWSLLAAVLALACGKAQADEQAVVAEGPENIPVEKTEAAKPKITYSPKVEAKLTEYFGKLTAAQRKIMGARMKKEIEEVTKTTGLNADGTKALETAAQAAAEASAKDWSEKVSDLFRQQMGPESEQLATMLDQAMGMVENVQDEGDFGVGDFVAPVDQPAWAQALKQTLTVEQAAAWQKAQGEKKEAAGKEIREFLKPWAETIRDQHSVSLLAKSAAIKSALTLTKERAEALDALVKSSTEKSAEEVRKKAEKSLLAMESTQRQQMVKRGRWYFPTDTKDLPDQQSAWKEGLAKILTAEEQKQLKAIHDERKTRRTRALALLMLAQLDERVAFTASQRERLQPIAERVIQGQPSLFPEGDSENEERMNLQTLAPTAANAKEAELKAIIEPIQWKHWRENAGPQSGETDEEVPTPPKPKIDPPAKSARPPEPEDFEREVSDFLQEKSKNQRKELLEAMELKAEDAARVTGLGPEAIAHLQTAARGAMEGRLANWKTEAEQTVRAQLNEATPENVKQRLASIQDYYFSRGNRSAVGEHPIWETAVKTELTEPQRAAWKKEVEERKAFHERAVGALILAEFDRKVSLTNEQWKKLDAFLATALKEYLADIESMFSSSSWYVQSYSMFLPLAAVPEKDFKALLSKEQMDRWTGCDEFSNIANYWENIQRQHKERAKVEKK